MAPTPPEPVAGGQRTVTRDIVVIGASAGGVEALSRFVAGLPREPPAAIFVVLHIMASGTSVLAEILSRAGAVPAFAARDGERVERGQIVVAPPDHHMLLADDRVILSRGPRENGHRPAVDPLFRSAARTYGQRVIGVVLSGALDDGVAGLRSIRERGGAALVQDPAEAAYGGMPGAAVEHVDVTAVARLDDLPAALTELLEEPVAVEPAEPAEQPHPSPIGLDAGSVELPEGEPAGLTCPECSGPLWEQGEGSLVRFECRVGHGFSPESLVVEQSRALEAALWAALQSIEERADLLRRMARRATPAHSSSLEERARGAGEHAAVLRSTLRALAGSPDRPDVPGGEPEPRR